MAKTASKRNEESRAAKTLAAANAPSPAGGDSFAAMLEQSFGKSGSLEGSVVKGVITAVDKEHAMIDVGLKSEGRVALREFAAPGQAAELKVGDIVEVWNVWKTAMAKRCCHVTKPSAKKAGRFCKPALINRRMLWVSSLVALRVALRLI